VAGRGATLLKSVGQMRLGKPGACIRAWRFILVADVGLKAWVGSFFPAGAKQRGFSLQPPLQTVEGNTTFAPDVATVQRWRDETLPGFQFCFKFPQSISHHKRLQNVAVETAEFLDRLEHLGDRCGPAFLQLPPTFGPSHLSALTTYLHSLPKTFRYAVEVRHPEFFTEPGEGALEAALREQNVARVLFDVRGLRSAKPDDDATAAAQERKPNVPVRYTRSAPFAFVRYVAHPTFEANAVFLDEWAGRVAEWLGAGDDVFFFLHSPTDVISPLLAKDFQAR
jgi:uncharacterized protein YecE (DUF72 family)